jgi:HK97 family phage major capsid protein
VVQVTTDNWQGITSAGVTAGYAQEASEAGDDSPSFDQPSIHPERADVFVPYSVELGQDWAGLTAELTLQIQEAKDDLEADKFAFGTGTDQPQGVLIGGTFTVITAGTAAFAVGDVYKTEEALPPRHRVRASWVANRSIYNRVRQFDTNGGANLWTENLQRGLANQVPTPGNTGYNLIGYGAYEASTMGTTVAAGGTVAVLGDFSKYVIVDRIGMNVELIPHLFATGANRPSGQRGLFAFWRNSAEVVDPNAFRKLITLS